jgi:excisionase family DNA binding protein
MPALRRAEDGAGQRVLVLLRGSASRRGLLDGADLPRLRRAEDARPATLSPLYQRSPCPGPRGSATAAGPPLAEAPLSERLLTARELGQAIGLKPGTILDHWERGELPGYKFGRAVRFDLDEVLAAGRSRAQEEKRQPPLPCARPRT